LLLGLSSVVVLTALLVGVLGFLQFQSTLSQEAWQDLISATNIVEQALVTTPRSKERGFSVLTGRPAPYPSPKAPSEP
jgi:hypothetical protein